MRRRTWALIAAVLLTAGCASQPAKPSSAPEYPTLTAAPDPSVAHVAIIGELYTSGSPSEGLGRRGWPTLVERMLHEDGIKISLKVGAKTGSGYAGHSTPGSAPFVDQVRRVVGANNRLVVLFGSLNDQVNPPEQLAPLVQRTLAEAKTRAPDARLLVIGPAWVQPDPPPGMLIARDVIRAQAQAIGATFVDPLTEAWFANHPEMIGTDGNRPNDAGHVYMAEKIMPLIAQELRAPAAP